MAQVEAKATVNNFVGGLVTDFHELNTPQNVTVDEDNCDLDRKGSRKRRLGIDYETDYEFASTTTSTDDFPDKYLKTYKWSAINNDGNLNFLVVQVGATLSFFDLANDSISPNEKSFTVDLDDHKVSVTTVAPYPIQVASGKGRLFVVGEYITPFRIDYDADTDTITETEIDIRIRDLVQLLNDSDTLGFKTAEADFTDELYYDLYNQGWGTLVSGNDSTSPGSTVTTGVTALGFYRSKIGYLPPKSKPWYVGKRTAIDPGEAGYEIFDPSGVYENVDAGNTLAPLGHFILDPFSKDRTSVLLAQQAANPLTGGTYEVIGAFEIETEATRPSAVAFFSGRVFYGFGNTLYYSQILNEDYGNAGLCYQAADPTAEDINELVATDGGVITLPVSGKIISFIPLDNSLLIFSDNGVWALNGPSLGEGFSATGHSISKISSTGIKTDRSVVIVEGNPIWWNEDGIWALASDQQKQGFSVSNICDKKVQLFYNDIPSISKSYASGAYDRKHKIVTWIFNSESGVIHNSKYACNRCLNYDVLMGAFFPYTISDLVADSPFIVDVFASSDIIRSATQDLVVDRFDDQVVDGVGADVYVNVYTLTDTTEETGIKFLTFTPVEI